MSPLVSIMTPCYNGEKYVGRFLASVLAQTYDNIELVIVDDGSTDNTASIIKRYIPQFDAKGYKLIYVHQENGGVSSVMNKAMPLVNGDFITWFDADDFFTPHSIERRVKFLQENPQYDFCMCQMYEILDSDLTKVTKIWKRTPPRLGERDTLFIDFLIQQNVVFPNVWLVRREIFFKAHPTKKIFSVKHAHNWQMILPLAYNFKCGYIEEPLLYYVVRSDSISHSNRNLQQQVERHLDFIELLTATIKQLDAPNETELLDFVWARFMHKNLVLGIKHDNVDLILQCCQEAQERQLNIFGADNFDVGFLLSNYILPRINLQSKLAEIQVDISKINDKLKS